MKHALFETVYLMYAQPQPVGMLGCQQDAVKKETAQQLGAVTVIKYVKDTEIVVVMFHQY